MRLPLFAALASEDAVVDTEAAETWLADCRAVKRILVLPDTAHAIPLEPCWKSLTDDIAKFILNQA